MLKGDCNNCLHGNEPEDSEVCIECGIARKNYEDKIMTEYISREALPEKKEQGFFSDDEFNAGWNACLNAIASVPVTDMVPVVHAHWKWDPDGLDWGIGAWCCSECRSKAETWWAKDKKYNPLHCSGGYFCGNCGAKMDGDGE